MNRADTTNKRRLLRRLCAEAGVVSLAIISLASCGYSLLGQGNFLPPDLRTVQIPTFENRTTRVELEQRVTQAVASEMVSRSGLAIVSSEKQADVILKGVIESFGLTPVDFNEQGRATRYQVIVNAKIELLDHRNEDAVIWKNEHYNFTENYAIDPGSTDAFDQETRAIQEIAQRFATSVVSNLVEGF